MNDAVLRWPDYLSGNVVAVSFPGFRLAHVKERGRMGGQRAWAVHVWQGGLPTFPRTLVVNEALRDGLLAAGINPNHLYQIHFDRTLVRHGFNADRPAVTLSDGWVVTDKGPMEPLLEEE